MAIRWEESDLVAHHGRAYLKYREQVPMLIPAAKAPAGGGPAGDRATA
jgi:protein-S-isoprenylcysteine O-methyltransferase Ste14